jgi:hypothetical protein
MDELSLYTYLLLYFKQMRKYIGGLFGNSISMATSKTRKSANKNMVN